VYWKYLKYVIIHKWFVFIECCKMGIIWRGIVHDLSKLRPSEFIPYARYFYGDYPRYQTGQKEIKTRWPHIFKEDVDRKFDKAWLYHIHRNPHHWQFWLLHEDDGPIKNIAIPMKYLKEMLCDWRGAGRAITGKDNTPDWYFKNREKIILRIVNRRWIEKKLGLKTDS